MSLASLFLRYGCINASLALALVISVVSNGRAEEEWWAFRDCVQPPLPSVQATDRISNPIDTFLLAKLEERGLTYAPATEKRTIIRRLYFDLVGLPPQPHEVSGFLADGSPAAYDRLVDRLLASPQFGERWARHWLDVVGYVDTVGFDVDENNIILGTDKWRYRDYVVQSFNHDKPYDRFVTEQLSGDEMIAWRGAEKYTPQIRELLTATGFLRTAQDFTHEPESNIPLIHYMVLHDTVEIVTNSLLALTVNCARCHDHKFDPIEQEEYYRLQAIFTPAYNPQNWRPVFPYKKELGERGLPDVALNRSAEIDKRNRELDRQIDQIKRDVADLRKPYDELVFEKKLAKLPEQIRSDTKKAVRTTDEDRDAIQKYLVKKFGNDLKITATEVDAALSEDDKKKQDELRSNSASLDGNRPRYGRIQALYDVGPPPTTHFLRRGNYERPGHEVEPGILAALSQEGTADLPMLVDPLGQTSLRRTAFARWLTTPDRPASALLSRVLVNRVWMHIFGEGLVTTPGNFGEQGAKPTHPELLEWLSAEFMHRGWSLKSLVRWLVQTSAYRQTTRRELPVPLAPAAAAVSDSAEGSSSSGFLSDVELGAIDPANTYLWRMRLRRLESEVIRDAVLSSSEALQYEIGGPPLLLKPEPDGKIVIDTGKLPTPDAQWRRSVYLLARRGFHHSMMSVFDQPSVTTTCARRDSSAVPLQSLTMLNDAFLIEQASRFAKRVSREAGSAPGERIDMAFRIALGRQPNEQEAHWCAELLEKQTHAFKREEATAEEIEHQALTQLCHTLLNTSEFLYAE